MKNLILSLVTLISTVTLNGQTMLFSRDNTFLRVKLESTNQVSFGFQNVRYHHVTDIGLVKMGKTETIQLLTKIIQTMGTKNDLYIDKGSYSVMYLPDYPTSVALYDGDKYTFLTKSELQLILKKLQG